MLRHSNFKAAWWLCNAHLQTIAAKYLRRREYIHCIDEQLQCPDGDFIELAWTELPKASEAKPIVVILHGLQGSKDSHYATGMLKAIQAKGWIGVVMHFRGCGKHMNRLGRSYHSGDTSDVHWLTTTLTARYPEAALAIIGFSLGGNVLTRYLAENKAHPYRAASAICAPLHLASCSERINRGMSKVYQRYLVTMLLQSTRAKIEANLLPQLKEHQLTRIRSMREFDEQITAPINGFASADDYYQQASGQPVLADITSPCLIIHANDDPFLSHQHIVQVPQLPDNVHFEVCNGGGHVGFICGSNPLRPQYWLEQRVPSFLADFL